MGCLDENAMVELADGRLAPSDRDRALRHLEACTPCRRTVARALRALELAPAHEPSFTIDRYRVIDFIGEGAMGIVYRAHDPRIDREVALKVVLPERSDAHERARLLREARALGRMSHPNVLAVFDAGIVDDAVFVAFELVEGHDLRTVLKDRTRPIADVLALFRQAAQGLLAAHEAGLVHLDFKPDNVLVGSDGRVRVADFGLAASSADAGGGSGTHGYMAPEQRAHAAIDARADQYAFCVSLHEALYGSLPGDDAREPATIRPGRVTRSLRSALRRGLSAAPHDRFADLQPIIAALAPPRPLPLRLAVVATLAIVVLVATRSETPAPAPTTAMIVAAPDPALAHAHELRLAGKLDEAAAEARAVAAQARADHQLARLAEAELLLGKSLGPSLRSSDASEVLLRAIGTAEQAGREDLRAEGLIALAGIEARDPATATRARRLVADARRILVAHGLEQRLGHAADWAEGVLDFETSNFDDAVVLFTRAYEGARRKLPSDHPFLAQYRWTLATALDRVGRHDEATALYQQSRREAAATLGEKNPQYAMLLAAIAAQQTNAGRDDVALPDFERALAILRASLGEDAQPTLDVRGDLGVCLARLGRHDEALAQLEEVLARALPSSSPTVVADAYADLGDEHYRHDELDAAQAAYDEALAWARRGAPSSTAEARMMTRVAMARLERDLPDGVRELLEEALAIHEVEGSPALDVAHTEIALARELWAAGLDEPRAIALAEQARDRLGTYGGFEAEHREAIETWLRERLPDA